MGIVEFRTGDFEKAVKFLSASEKAFETFEVVFENDDKELKNETIAGDAGPLRIVFEDGSRTVIYERRGFGASPRLCSLMPMGNRLRFLSLS